MNDIIIREAINQDKEQILELLNTVFDQVQRSEFKRGDEFWNWKYQDNVFGKPILTVAEIDNKIVGVNNLWPWEFSCRGTIIKGLQPCDSVIHKDFQGFGLFMKMRLDGLKRAKESGCNLIFNFPNQNSIPSYINLGWTGLGKLPWHVLVLKPLNILLGKLNKGKSIPFVLSSAYQLKIDFLEKINSTNYDEFVKTNYVQGYFLWRYIQHPTLSYGMISIENKYKSAAAIFTIKQNGINREMVVVEILGHAASSLMLFKKIKLEAIKLNVDFIAVLENKKFKTERLWRLGFFKKASKNFVVLPLDISIEHKVSHYSHWSMMASLHDSI